jgi:hypothetical protein
MSNEIPAIKNNSFEHSKLVEEIFDSVGIYLHLIGESDSTSLAISNIPFTEKDWKDKLHLIDFDLELSMALRPNDPEFATTLDSSCMAEISYSLHRKLLYNLAYIFSIRGHEVYICLSKNPGPKNGSYTHYSASLKERLTQEKQNNDPRSA